MINQSKKFFLKNKEKINAVATFAHKCIENVAEITQLQKDPSIFNYANLAFKLKENLKLLKVKNINTYFLDGRWESYLSYDLRPLVCGILEKYFGPEIFVIAEKESSCSIHICKLSDEIQIGWVMYGEMIDEMYVTSRREKEANAILGKEIWKKFDGNCLTIGTFQKNWADYMIINEEKSHETFVKSIIGEKYSEHIKKYQDKGLGRAILFYGPPGTGKSNIVKDISNSLKLKTVRLQKLDTMRNSSIVKILEIFNPGAIIMEDVDHLYSSNISQLLEKIESFNAMGKCILATANEITKINGALLRPGRFDELIEILNMDAGNLQELIGDDQELMEMIKDYPAAYIMELLKRIKIDGKAEALANMADLKKRVEHSKKVEYKL